MRIRAAVLERTGAALVVEELPRNSAGKVLKNELRRLPADAIIERRG